MHAISYSWRRHLELNQKKGLANLCLTLGYGAQKAINQLAIIIVVHVVASNRVSIVINHLLILRF
jgi:hypothetical protein